VGNKILSCLSGRRFGSFEKVTRTGFGKKYTGLFKVAHGTESHFLHALDYVGPEDFSSAEAFVVDLEAGQALSLTPFMFWHAVDGKIDPTIAVLDMMKKDETGFKLIESGKVIILHSDHELSELHQTCVKALEEDSVGMIFTDLAFTDTGGT
jgi:hypothetical protein